MMKEYQMIIFKVRFFANSWNVRLLLRIHEMVHDVGRKALVLFLFHLGLFLEACISYLQRKVEKKQRLFITISRILFNKNIIWNHLILASGCL